MKIIYNENGKLVIIHPTKEAIGLFGIDFIAGKDVPAGFPYAIIEDNEIPSDVPRDALQVNDADLTSGIGWEIGAGSNWAIIEISGNVLLVEEHFYDSEGKLTKGRRNYFNIDTQEMEVTE